MLHKVSNIMWLALRREALKLDVKGGFLEGAIPKVNSKGSEEVRVVMGRDIQKKTTSRWLVEYIDPGKEPLFFDSMRMVKVRKKAQTRQVPRVKSRGSQTCWGYKTIYNLWLDCYYVLKAHSINTNVISNITFWLGLENVYKFRLIKSSQKKLKLKNFTNVTS